MSNHTGALRRQAQHTLNLNTFYTPWSVFLILAETDPTQILLAISENVQLHDSGSGGQEQ